MRMIPDPAARYRGATDDPLTVHSRIFLMVNTLAVLCQRRRAWRVRWRRSP
jgi:hypothetical protein